MSPAIDEARPLNIGIACWASFGGSGIMATEIGLAMARRGHRVHFVSKDVPRRYDRRVDRVYFHSVSDSDYPLLEGSAYTVALASKIVEVSGWDALDLVHVHYAVPHAASAALARAALGDAMPRVIMTLHGTDTTLVGPAPSYRPVIRACIEQCEGITVPSRWLAGEARARLGISEDRAIEVLPNFVDTESFAPATDANGRCLRDLFDDESDGPPRPEDRLTLVHVSNFRAVKRVGDVVEVFTRVARDVPGARLLMIGDGPDRSRSEAALRREGLGERVRFLGMQEHFAELLRASDVFLLPSESESFGLAALEAQSCGVPVVGSDVGGIPEVVVHGETGLLAPVGDVDAMVAHVLSLARDAALRQRLGRAAREHVLRHFPREPVMDAYEAYYRKVLAQEKGAQEKGSDPFSGRKGV